MGRVTERRKVIRIRDGAVSTRPDTLVAEEPLEIRLNGKPLAITMRTPGDDFALAAGFLVSEGVLGRADELQNIVYCVGATVDGSNTYNVVDVTTAPGVVIPDITRPLPSDRLLPWLFEELSHVPAENVTIVNGTGSHRPARDWMFRPR